MSVLADRYELLEPLGAGGMARVVAAHDRRLDRRVAIKLVHERLLADPSTRQRLLREARAAAGLHHPGTIAVHDVGEHDGRPFIVMELVEGETLEERLRARGRLPVGETLAIGGALLEALQAAHARGLVHRDVKPSNVLLPVAGGVKLADFGIARALEGSTTTLTATGQVLGTPRYLAPEQAAGRPPTPASDLYALGVLLYECLAGRPPFDGPSSVAVALAHQRDPVPPLREHAPHVPPALAAAVERALAKDPDRRFADASAMRGALLRGGTAGPTGAAGDTAPPTRILDRDGPATTARVIEDTAAIRPDRDVPARRGGTLSRAVVAMGLAAALTLGLLVGLRGADEAPTAAGGSPEGSGPAADPSGTQEGGTLEGTGGPEPASPGDPLDGLTDLIADLARDPDAAGERGPRLLDQLMRLRDEEPAEQAEEARKRITGIASWIADGRLETRTGRRAVLVLEPIARPSAPTLARTSALFAEVASDKRSWGERADDLLDELEDLLGQDDAGDRAEDAADLVDEVDTWVEEGGLDAGLGRRALEVLRPLAADAP